MGNLWILKDKATNKILTSTQAHYMMKKEDMGKRKPMSFLSKSKADDYGIHIQGVVGWLKEYNLISCPLD